MDPSIYKEKNLIYDQGYLATRYKMTEEEYNKHKAIVLQELDILSKELINKKDYKKETVLAVSYSPEPLPIKRNIDPLKDYDVVLDYKKPWTLADDKSEYPSQFRNEFVVGIKTNLRTFIFRVYAYYRWNNADIWGVLQIIALCSKDDRRVILGSGLHDFLLEHKQELFEEFYNQDPILTVDEYRWITSDTFRWVINSQGMGPLKSKMMANLVDNFQKNFQKKKWRIKLPNE